MLIMKKSQFLTVLFTLSASLIFSQTRLQVNGDARIQGKIALQQSPTDSSLFIGTQAGQADLGNNENTFIGINAGRNTSTGGGNVFVGRNAGINNSEGLRNTMLGYYTGIANSTGGYNVFLGYRAGPSNTTGSENIFIGDNAGQNNTIGHSNVFLGSLAGGLSSSGNFNVFLGLGAGYGNGNGVENVAVGTQAGASILRGNYNTFLGYRAGGTTILEDLSKAIGIGYEATVTCSNCAVIGGTDINAVNVGIGTSNPRGALHLLTIGDPPTGLDASENGLLLGVSGTASYKWIQSYGGALALNSEGNNVGISTALPNYRLEVNGSAGKPGGGDWTNSASDRRLKKNIRPYEDGMEQLLRIKPVWYQYNDQTKLPTDQEYVGIIAQEIQQIAPYTVGSFQYEGTEYLNFDGSALRYMLINAVKELHRELEIKEDRISKLEKENQQLENRLDHLEAALERLLAEETEGATGNKYTLTLERGASLEQNIPNPFQQQTKIEFFIPDHVKEAKLAIHNPEGKNLKTVAISKPGAGEVLVKTNTFPAGIYFYSLVLDGQVFETKRMILNK